MLQLIQWAPALLGLAKKFVDSDHIDTAIKATNTAGRLINDARPRSISAAAAKSIISPLVVIENTLAHQEYMVDLMTLITLRDIRDTLTHINYQSEIGGMKIGKLIDQVNPNRTAGFMCLQGCEAFEPVKLPSVGNSPTQLGGKGDELKGLAEYFPLALGRTVNASVFVDGKEQTFPLTFKQVPILARPDNIELMFTAVKGKAGWSERIKEYKAGGITQPELLGGIDEIRNEFKIRTRDMTGYYGEAVQRERNNMEAMIRTGEVSVNSLANTIIMSQECAYNVETEIGIRFGSSKMGQIRRAVRANTIVVVDDARGIFSFYTAASQMVERYTRDMIRVKARREDATNSLESLVKLLNGR